MNEIIQNNQTMIESTLQSYIKNLSSAQMLQVLDFIEYLNFKNNKDKSQINQAQTPISHYAGMIQLPKTGTPRSLMDFDVASMAKDG